MKYYLSTRTYLTAYLMYRTRLLFKISGRQMHKHFQMKQSTYAKVETGALKLTLDNFFNSVMAMYFTLGEFEEFIKKIEETIYSDDDFEIHGDDEYYRDSDNKLLSFAISECEDYLPEDDDEEAKAKLTKTNDVRGFDELLGVVNVAKIDLLLAQHYAKLDDQQISFRQKL
ncbi:hypothetical protein [Acinetobacter johnsonii]|uniref:hypothetical protein n=1 Tax=Acinetobacter johnsonii TaxID=40214 RepID=UPI002936CAC4|nr:hypothetical protein [Acinetobacter johnsonii]MDV2489114.1 hypothetical protein [Acinetobacter johnsonii]